MPAGIVIAAESGVHASADDAALLTSTYDTSPVPLVNCATTLVAAVDLYHSL